DYSTNVVLCCCRCNSSKSYRSVAQWIANSPILPWAVVDPRRQLSDKDHLIGQLSLFEPSLRAVRAARGAGGGGPLPAPGSPPRGRNPSSWSTRQCACRRL